MATVKTGSSALEASAGFLAESTFGTVNLDSANFTLFEFVGGGIPAFNPTMFVDDTLKNNGTIVGDIGSYFQTENGQWQRISLPDFIGRSDIVGAMLYSVCQTVSEAVGTPFVKTYTLNGATDPDFSSSAGYFYSYLQSDPIASNSDKLTSCVTEELRIKIGSENGGRMVCSANVLTGLGYTRTSNPSGTNAFSSVAIPSYFDAVSTLTVDSQDLIWDNAEIIIATQYAWIGNSSGSAENYKLLRQDVDLNVNVKYDTNSDQMKANKGSDINTTTLTIGTNSSAGYFKIESANTWLSDVQQNISGNEIVSLDLNLKLLRNDSAAENITIELADGVDQAW